MLAPQAQVHAVDVNSRSISLTERNAAALGLPNVTVGTPESVDPELRFDTIWSNPPIPRGQGGPSRDPADLAAAPGTRR